MTEDAPTSGIHLPGLPSLTAIAAIHNEVGLFLNVAPKIINSPLGMFFPEVRRLGLVLPAVQALHDLIGELENAGGDPNKMIAAIEAHFSSVVATTRAALAKVSA